MSSVWPLRRRSWSCGMAGLVEALTWCIPALSSSRKRRPPLPLDAGVPQLTLGCARSAKMLALNRRVALSLDLVEIAAWQAELQVSRGRDAPVSFPPATWMRWAPASVFTHFKALYKYYIH